MDIGQAEVATLEAEGQPGVFEPEQVQDGRVDIVDVATIFDRAEAKLVRLAEDLPGFHTRAGEPHRE